MDPEFWRAQALKDLIPYWAEHAPDPENGAFFMNLSRDWKPLPPWDKVPALISRHVFGFSAAYLLSGEAKYLDIARQGADYLYQHAWDPEFSGWFDKLTRDGKPLVGTKSISLQLYTNVGLTLYYIASGDERALSLVRKSVDIQRTKGFDAARGGYVQALNRDLTVANYGKNKHAHYGYIGSLLLNLYLATDDPEVLAWEKELADISLAKMVDKYGWIHGFRSLFDRDWQRTPALVDNREVVSVGAELTAALAFLRLYHQTGDRKYLDAGRRLGEQVTCWGFDRGRGCWYDLIETAPPHDAVAKPIVWWWVQIYGSFLQLQLYRVTGDEACLDTFRRSEAFFVRYFRDHDQGGVFGSVTPDGHMMGEGRKASDSEWHTSYHEMEHALLNYLYLHLYVNRTPAVLHYRLDGPRKHYVALVDDPAVRISEVTMDGQRWSKFDSAQRSVEVPTGNAHVVEVTFIPGGQPAISKSLEDRIAAYVGPYVRTNNFSGAILVTQGEQALFRRGFGYAVREFDVPATPETKFHIASVSKSFTAAAIMILEQQGKLRTSDPLNRYLPDYPNGGRLTLHHLLAHTSGVPNVNSLPDYDAKSRFPHQLDEILSWFKDRPLEFEPGARYSYSNSNYNILAAVIEKVSGKGYGEFMEEAIFRPLGMKDTAHHGDAQAVIPRLAVGYSPAGGDAVERAPFLDWSIKTGNGSLYTTADDLAKWDRALYGDALLEAASRSKIFAEHTEGVGYGWFIRKGRHPSVAYAGRAPGFSASIERFTDNKTCVIVLSNLYSSIAQSMAGDIAAIVFGEERRPLIPAIPMTVAEAETVRCVGRYQFGKDFAFNPGAAAEIKRDGRWLVLAVGGGGGTSYLIPVGGGRFIDRAYGGTVSFETDARGKVKALIWNFGRDYHAVRLP